jgi:hypothetical protein
MSSSTLNTVKTLALFALIAVDFLLFYQTTLGGSFATVISQVLIKIIPFLATVVGLIPPLLFGIFSIVMAVIYVAAKNRRIKIFSIISFVLFLPAAISTPSINWLETNNFSNILGFFVTAVGGFIAFSCLIILNETTRLSKTKTELLSRGSDASEVQSVINASVSFVGKAVLGSVGLSAAAVLLYIVGQPLGSQIESSSITYLPFIIGMIAVVSFSAIIYYYLLRPKTDVTLKA